MANGKLQPFINLNQSKLHCYTLSTTCTLFKLASEVGPRTINDSFQSSNFLLLCCSLLISVNGKTYKSAIKRPIKIRTHHDVRKHTHRTSSCTGGQTAGRTFRWTDGQI